jgi:hypothetical protein
MMNIGTKVRAVWWTGGGSKESGVYGLGVILLELVSGRSCEGVSLVL